MARLDNQFEWSLINHKEIYDRLDKMGKVTGDFRIPFTLIANDFYKSQRKIFMLKGPGRYVDLTPKYKKRKKKEVGFAYPILLKTGRLANSTLGPSNRDSVFSLTRNSLVMGSSTPYGIYHQSDAFPRRKIPQRKFIFIDGGPGDKAQDGVNGRRERWLNIIQSHVNQIVLGRI